MPALLKNFFFPQSYIPHGHCYLWQTPLVSLHVVSDLLIAVAYFSIPVVLLLSTYRYQRQMLSHKVTVLFSSFILLCGTGHLLDIVTLWYPIYWVSGTVRALTAIISVYTAFELITLVPQLLSLRRPEDLVTINAALEREIAERKEAENTLKTLVSCTAAATGPEFFSVLATSLATSLAVRDILIVEKWQDKQARSLAFWSDGELLDTVVYDIAGTPCEMVFDNKQTYYCQSGVQQIFPQAVGLQPSGVDCYLGVPLLDVNDDPIGVLCLRHPSPIQKPQRVQSLMAVFAARVSSELQRQRAQQALRQANDSLESRIQQRTAELAQAKSLAESANRAKSTFIAKISHELRTPLNAVLGFAQVMAQDHQLTTDHRKTLEIINRSGAHLLTLINDILEITKVEAGQLTSHETDFDLFQLLSELENRLRPRAAAKGLALVFDCDRTLSQYLHGDEGKLRQILINLLDNAIKFTHAGRVILSLRCPDTRQLEFTVTDTGPGITPKDQAHIFELFYQSDAHHTEAGTGLGLAIINSFIKHMDGEIIVDSRLQAGTTFTVRLPIIPIQSVTPYNPSDQYRVVSLIAQQPCRLLVAEDAPTNRLLLRKVLGSVGFELMEACNGEEAVQLWKTWHPDLILMDMQMPVLDGYQATAQIKHLAKVSRVAAPPIIALTASTFDEQQRAIRAAGCDMCIHKPFQREQLLHVIAMQLNLQYRYEQAVSESVACSTQHPSYLSA
ncbi:MAG: ATP-binding protein [Cyanobacteria bacterium P01_A01_bin.105]